jgi:hypothetical protein
MNIPIMLNKSSWALIIASFLTLILYIVPTLHIIAYPFILISTYVHEMSHGVAALLVGGHFDSFHMWADGSGLASIKGNFGAFSRAFIAAAGLIGPACMSSLCFLCIKTPRKARFLLACIGIILALSLLLVVRNTFGIFFVIILCALCLYFSLGRGFLYAQTLLAFIAAQLALSVFSRSDYLFTKNAQTSSGPMPSDVAQIADALFLPYWFWGALCGIFSIGVLLLGLKSVLKSSGKAQKNL